MRLALNEVQRTLQSSFEKYIQRRSSRRIPDINNRLRIEISKQTETVNEKKMPKKFYLIDALYNVYRIIIIIIKSKHSQENPIPPKYAISTFDTKNIFSNCIHIDFCLIMLLGFSIFMRELCVLPFTISIDQNTQIFQRCDGAILLLMLFKLSHRI